jgi:hypothetical protein
MEQYLHGEKFKEYGHRPINKKYISDNNVLLTITNEYNCDYLMIDDVDSAEITNCFHRLLCSLCGNIIKFQSMKTNKYEFHFHCFGYLRQIKNNKAITHIRLPFNGYLLKLPIYAGLTMRVFITYDGYKLYAFTLNQGFNIWPIRTKSLHDELRKNPTQHDDRSIKCYSCQSHTYFYYKFMDVGEYCCDCMFRYTKLKRNLVHKHYLMCQVIIGDIVNVLIRMIVDVLNYCY